MTPLQKKKKKNIERNVTRMNVIHTERHPNRFTKEAKKAE